MVYTADILDPERFWTDELIIVNKNVLHACYRWSDSTQESKGLIDSHAYSIIRAVECEGIKLLQIRNPWGKTEWNGPWSDGSKEWTPERMQLLGHKFGDDGSFWMTYEDFLKQWTVVDSCKLFDSSWQVYTTWIQYNVVPKSNGKFILTVPEDSFTIIVLQQPDDRYFSVPSKYSYQLSFRVYEKGCETYKARSRATVRMAPRGINLEIQLPAGTYEIVPRINRKEEEEEESSTKENKEDKKKVKRVKNLALGLDANDDSGEEEEEEKNEKDDKEKKEWELSLGLRVYSQNKNLILVGEEGEYPKVDKEDKKEDDPEADTKATDEKKEGEDKKDDEKEGEKEGDKKEDKKEEEKKEDK